jgi:hypothetical protein
LNSIFLYDCTVYKRIAPRAGCSVGNGLSLLFCTIIWVLLYCTLEIYIDCTYVYVMKRENKKKLRIIWTFDYLNDSVPQLNQIIDSVLYIKIADVSNWRMVCIFQRKTKTFWKFTNICYCGIIQSTYHDFSFLLCLIFCLPWWIHLGTCTGSSNFACLLSLPSLSHSVMTKASSFYLHLNAFSTCSHNNKIICVINSHCKLHKNWNAMVTVSGWTIDGRLQLVLWTLLSKVKFIVVSTKQQIFDVSTFCKNIWNLKFHIKN